MHASGLEVADIFNHAGSAYRQQHAESLSRGQRCVMSAIERCRTAALGGHVEQCDSCLLYTSPSPRDGLLSRMPSSA